MNEKRHEKELEDFKYLIDSRTLSDEDRKAEREAILKAREARFRKRSGIEISTAQLIQLKYQMEDYVDNPAYSPEPRFSEFLKKYVDTLYKKRAEFASDLSIEPMMLSQVLNNHRNPKDTFMCRLIIHSVGSYKSLCDFNRELWPRVYYQDKMYKFISSQDKLRESEEEYVRHKNWDH